MTHSQNPLESHQSTDEPFIAIEVLPPVVIERGWNVKISWAVIILVTVGIFCLVFFDDSKDGKTETSKSGLMAINSQSKMMVGSRELSSAPVTAGLDSMNRGALEGRYGIVLLKNELFDADAASKMLSEIDKLVQEKSYQPTDSQLRLREIVGCLLDEYREEQWDSSVISVDDREFFVEQLGWIGRLGLTPSKSPNSSGREKLLAEATWSSIAMVSVSLVIGLGFVIGVVMIVMLSVFVSTRRIVPKLPDRSERSVVYLETFAIWIFLFFVVFQVLGSLIVIGLEIEGTIWSNLLQLGMFFASLIAIVWPTFRGLTFREVRQDIGWTCKNPLKEIGAGIVSYLALLPLIGGFLIIVGIVMSQTMQSQSEGFESTEVGGHPIQDQIASGDYTIWLSVVLLAVVAAPIVEETMFRGVFYRYLKDASSFRRFWGSVAFASCVNGIVFASLHPQGLIGIPLLTTLAIGMSLARQWRDSLIASMTMHAINNGMITCLMFAVF